MISYPRGSVADLPSVRVYGRSPGELEGLGIELAWTACPLGGSRPWLVCPRCGRSAGVLYYADSMQGDLACRLCLELFYPSTRETPLHRLIRRAQALRRRLRGPANLLEPIPGKPPRMHWSRYLRLRRRLETHEERVDAALGVWCAGTVAWLERRRARIRHKAD
jgi:hypothetical protein